MKKKLVILSSVLLIGVMAGLALSHLISNSASFQIQVDSISALNVDVINQPIEPIYQGNWYNDQIELNISNNDVNQGYDFYLVVRVQHSGLLASNVDMNVKHSEGNRINYDPTAQPLTIVQDGSNWVNGTYKFGSPMHIDAQPTGNWKIFFLISFKISGASSGPFTFKFEAWAK